MNVALEINKLKSLYCQLSESLKAVDPLLNGVLTKEEFKVSTNTSHTLMSSKEEFIWKIVMKPASLSTLRIGTTLGGDEIMFDAVVPANTWYSSTQDLFNNPSNLTLYFSGIVSTTTIIIYKLKL